MYAGRKTMHRETTGRMWPAYVSVGGLPKDGRRVCAGEAVADTFHSPQFSIAEVLFQ